MTLTVAPLTPDRWCDLETIFRAKGCSVARGCWCMAYRFSGSREPLPPGMTRAQANRAGLKALVDAGNPPGLIGYHGKVPVGWVSVGPREEYAKLKRSPVMKASGQSSALSCRPSTVAKVWHRRSSKEPSPTPGNRAQHWLRPTLSTNLFVAMTSICGSGQSPCTTKPASRKSHAASRRGLSSASNLLESPCRRRLTTSLWRSESTI